MTALSHMSDSTTPIPEEVQEKLNDIKNAAIAIGVISRVLIEEGDHPAEAAALHYLAHEIEGMATDGARGRAVAGGHQLAAVTQAAPVGH